MSNNVNLQSLIDLTNYTRPVDVRQDIVILALIPQHIAGQLLYPDRCGSYLTTMWQSRVTARTWTYVLHPNIIVMLCSSVHRQLSIWSEHCIP